MSYMLMLGWLRDKTLEVMFATPLTAVFAFVVGVTGNTPVYTWLNLVIIDFIVGASHAWQKHTFAFHVAREGLVRKLTWSLVIAFGHTLDRHIGTGDYFKGVFANLLCALECISILRHFSAMGLVFPESLRNSIAAAFAVTERDDGRTDDEPERKHDGHDGDTERERDPDGGESEDGAAHDRRPPVPAGHDELSA